MRFLLLIILAISFCAHALAAPYTVETIKTMIRDRNIRTMEEFIAELPEDILTEYTLMHNSKSLHGSSFQEPRTILYGKTGQWIVTFNGSTTQAAGKMVEMMLYNPSDKTYAFHELDFSKETPVLIESPAKCLACHGSNPRPIFDHYNAWPGAYGDVDDRFNEQEYKYLTEFIAKAPEHPRYKYLRNLKESYKLSLPGMRGGLTERSMVNHNRDLNLVMHKQKLQDITAEMVNHPKYQKVKNLIFYFLSKCYMKPGVNYNGDGNLLDKPEQTIAPLLKNVVDGKAPNLESPFQPEQFLDYLYSRLEVDTNSWYLNSRDLATYKILKDGSDRMHESLLNYFIQLTPEYQGYYNFSDVDFQITNLRFAVLKDQANTCKEFASLAPEGVKALGLPMPDVNTPNQTMRGERVCRGIPRKCETIYRTLPSICLKCHTQTPGFGKIYLPFHEFPERDLRGDNVLTKRMYDFITSKYMPMRSSSDTAVYNQYYENDFPKLKKYLEDLLKKESPNEIPSALSPFLNYGLRTGDEPKRGHGSF